MNAEAESMGQRIINQAAMSPNPQRARFEPAVESLEIELGKAQYELSRRIDAAGEVYGAALAAVLRDDLVIVHSRVGEIVMALRNRDNAIQVLERELALERERKESERRAHSEHYERADRAEGHLVELYGGMQRIDRRRPPEWVTEAMDRFA